MELYKTGIDIELNLLRTVYPQLNEYRLFYKAKCAINDEIEQLDVYLIGPFVFGFAPKPSNATLVIYLPQYCFQYIKSEKSIVFLPVIAYLKHKITINFEKTSHAKAFHKSIIDVCKTISKISMHQVPPVSIVGNYFDASNQTSSFLDLNMFGNEVVIKITKGSTKKILLNKQKVICLAATESPNVPNNIFYYSFQLITGEPKEKFIVCQTLDQFIFSFVSIDIISNLCNKKKEDTQWKVSAPFVKNNKLIDSFKLISEMKAPIIDLYYKTTNNPMESKLKVPIVTSTKPHVIDIEKSKRTLMFYGSLKKSEEKQTSVKRFPSVNVLNKSLPNTFESIIEGMRDTISDGEEISSELDDKKKEKSFMSKNGKELSNIIYFRHISDPNIPFICQKIGINFTNPVFSINGEEELKLLKKQKTLSDFSLCLASILINGSNEYVFVSNILKMFENNTKIISCFPKMKLSTFTLLTIFISRLVILEKIGQFINIFSSSPLRNKIYRNDAMCISPLFLELLYNYVNTFRPTSIEVKNEDVFPLQFARRQRFEYLVISSSKKAKNDPLNTSAVSELISYIVQFFLQGIDSRYNVWDVFETCCKSSASFDSKPMMSAAEQFISKSNKSPINKFANALLMGLQCGQLYSWVLFIGLIAKQNRFYSSSSPVLITENIVIIADSLYKLSTTMFDVDSSCLDSRKELQ